MRQRHRRLVSLLATLNSIVQWLERLTSSRMLHCFTLARTRAAYHQQTMIYGDEVFRNYRPYCRYSLRLHARLSYLLRCRRARVARTRDSTPIPQDFEASLFLVCTWLFHFFSSFFFL
jgi:hypothetical protein